MRAKEMLVVGRYTSSRVCLPHWVQHQSSPPDSQRTVSPGWARWERTSWTEQQKMPRIRAPRSIPSRSLRSALSHPRRTGQKRHSSTTRSTPCSTLQPTCPLLHSEAAHPPCPPHAERNSASNQRTAQHPNQTARQSMPSRNQRTQAPRAS